MANASDRAQSHRYLYERLDEKRFQQLCASLLAHTYPKATAYTVGQSDGGRDIVRRKGGRAVIYQVKWTSKPLQDPVGWLNKAISGETKNIQRLVNDGAVEYYLMTSVAGTAVPSQGTMDRLQSVLSEYSRQFGIPMTCWWRADIDARVDAAPREVKWAYPDMLAGVDAIRYLIEADELAGQERALRALLRQVLSTQWDEDAKVKFKQVELESQSLADLFVDVEAVRTAQAGSPYGSYGSRFRLETESLGGAASYLLASEQPCSLIRGNPGQGKSTLGQFVCQVHRADFLGEARRATAGVPKWVTSTTSRIPIRVDLREYADWLYGGDPFSGAEHGSGAKKRKERAHGSLELFLVDLLYARSGGLPVSRETVRDLLERYPTLLMLDGLDEVAHETLRERVTREIDDFAARASTTEVTHQIVVTTRPNASGMAEPSGDRFETVVLMSLDEVLRVQYLRKWADANAIRGRHRRELERVFRERSAEPHILQLANNPMQLTILLYLMHRRGTSVPAGRTDLYKSYLDIFLDREAVKTPAIDEHRADLQEVMAFLGWHMQSLAETDSSRGALPIRSLKKAILDYLFSVGKDTRLVDELFTAVTDRVWALSSKLQGTFEFEVQSLREYFAARFLSEFAGADARDFDSAGLLRHLVRRPYWLNTARFYAGFAKANELAGLLDGLDQELEDSARPQQVRLAAWTLLSDGVFSIRQRTQQTAVRMFAEEDLSIRLLLHAFSVDPETPALAEDRGGQQFVELLHERLETSPDANLAGEFSALALLLEGPRSFEQWWGPRMRQALGTVDDAGWLRMGAAHQFASRLGHDDCARLGLGDDTVIAAVSAGVCPEPGSELENHMVRVVLAGLCSDTPPATASLAQDLLRVFAPQHHIRRAVGEQTGIYPRDVGHLDMPVPKAQRQAALRRLVSRDGRFHALQQSLQFRKGQSRTTSPWGNSARALAAIYGPCWLAAEAAIIGANLHRNFTPAGDITPDSAPLGAQADYGRLSQEIQFNRGRQGWWEDTYDQHPDHLSRATWALALVVAAERAIILPNLPRLASVTSELPEPALKALLTSSSRISASMVGRSLSADLLKPALDLSPTVALLVGQQVGRVGLDDLPAFSDDQLGQLSTHGIPAWPALNALTVRMIKKPSASTLMALGRFGPNMKLPAQLAVENENIGAGSAREILRRAAQYPLKWVLMAEKSLAQSAHLDSLASVAGQEGWFGE